MLCPIAPLGLDALGQIFQFTLEFGEGCAIYCANRRPIDANLHINKFPEVVHSLRTYCRFIRSLTS